MNRWANLVATGLLAVLPAVSAQSRSRKAPDPPPTEQELVEYIRGDLLALSPGDSINDNLDVSWDATNKVLSVKGPAGYCEFFMASLNPNHAEWDIYDPSDSFRTREKILRLTLVSVSGKTARTCYDRNNRVDATILGNRARFLFSLPKADEEEGFQAKIAKAFKSLIVESGGMPEKDLF